MNRFPEWSSFRHAVTLALCVLLLNGCGESSGVDAGGSLDGRVPGADASTMDSGPEERIDSGPASDAGLVDGDVSDGEVSDGGVSDAGSAAACGEGPLAPGGIAWTCSGAECYDSLLCIDQQLAAQGYADYVPCGEPQVIDPASSDAACTDVPFVGGVGDTPRRCGLISFSGQVRFYCAPDGAGVVARFHARFPAPPGGELYGYGGHDYFQGSGGGSGDSYWFATPTDDGVEEFIGSQFVALTPGGMARLNVWFLVNADTDYFIAGGFVSDLPP